MVDVKFLNLAEVIEIHSDQIARYVGKSGVRDMELLKPALGTPLATYGGEFLHTDIYEMAAAYLYHITMNHPFVDGNKRTGAVSAIIFLIINGYELNAPEDELAGTVLELAEGRLSKADIAIFLRKWTIKV